jgi:hypothetical protein
MYYHDNKSLFLFTEPATSYVISLMAFNKAGDGPITYETVRTEEDTGEKKQDKYLYLSPIYLPTFSHIFISTQETVIHTSSSDVGTISSWEPSGGGTDLK